MRMSLFVCVCLFACAALSQAQTVSSYRYDNFDTKDGVKVSTVPTTAVLPKDKKVRPVVKPINPNDVANAHMSSGVYTRARVPEMMRSTSLDGFTTGDAQVDSFIADSGQRNGVDPVLLYAVMHQESTFKQRAVSPKGARGLMQLMPATAVRFGVSNIFDPKQNIEGGARYIRFLLDTFDGDVALALAGYNAGEGAVMKYGRSVPPYRETQEYVRRIMARYTLMRDPLTARNARLVNPTQVAQAVQQQKIPLNLYERNVYAVRLPDGRLQLVSQ